MPTTSNSTGTPSAWDVPPELRDPVRMFWPWFCGGFAEFLLTGALFALTANYWFRYRKSDILLHKIFVDLCTILSIARTVQVAAILWYKLVYGFGDYVMASYSSPWYATTDPLTSELLCLVAQLFFVIRLWKMLGGLKWLLLLLVPAMLMAVVGQIALTVQVHNLSTIDDLARFTKTSYVALVGTVASDIIVTCATSFYLHRARTGFKRTDSLIGRLLHLTWITAAFPAIASLLQLITYVSLSPKGLTTFIAFELVAPKLYALSMLYTLNTRKNLSRRGEEDSYRGSSTSSSRHGLGVSVTTDTVRFADEHDNVKVPTSVRFSPPSDRGDFETSSQESEIKEMEQKSSPV